MHYLLTANKSNHEIKAFIFKTFDEFLSATGSLNVRGLIAFDHGYYHPSEKPPGIVTRHLSINHVV